MTNIDICNMALSFLRVDVISSLEQETQNARTCKQFYETMRRTLLRDYEWSFSKKYEQLALINETHSDWEYLYSFPSDCINIRQIIEEKRDNSMPTRINQNKFDVFLISNNRRAIACNVKNARAIYTCDITDTSLFPDDFSHSLAHAMAAKMAITLNADAGAQQLNAQWFEYYSLKSKTNNSNEKNVPFEYSDKYIKLRG